MASEEDMAKVMGFSNFGGKKKARQFDVTAMFEEAKSTAIERSAKALDEQQEAGLLADVDRASSHGAVKTATAQQLSDDDAEYTVGPPLPPVSGFSGTAVQSSSDDSDSDDVGPPLPPGMVAAIDKMKATGHSDSDSSDSEPESDNPVSKIPTSNSISLDHGNKTVSGITLDTAGARLCTGGVEYEVKFWDFLGMDSSLRPFRFIRPCESHPIRHLAYSPTGERILIISGNAQAKVVDRDGFEVLECVHGDQYLLDMGKTKGHTAMLNGGCWNPVQKDEFMTCSNDGSVRLWDVHQGGKQHKAIMRPRSMQGRRVVPTACTFSPDGRWIAVACQDGSLQFWDHSRKMLVNVAMINRNAHQNGTDTTCLAFSYDGTTLASRGGDDTLKLWDIRNVKTPLAVANNLENLFPMTDCCFSPDDKLVVTGVSVRKNCGMGKVVFFDRSTLQTVRELDVVDGSSVVRCLWHPRLNQMVVGCSDGNVKVYFDPDKSHRGALLCTAKQKRKKTQQVEMMISQSIVTPHALPMFKKDRPLGSKKREEKERKDPVKSHRPDMPIAGPGTGGRLANKGATLSQYVAQLLAKRKPDERDKDPRAAILRHAKDAAENPYWVDPAYKASQPKQIFQQVESDADNENQDEPVWKKHKI